MHDSAPKPARAWAVIAGAAAGAWAGLAEGLIALAGSLSGEEGEVVVMNVTVAAKEGLRPDSLSRNLAGLGVLGALAGISGVIGQKPRGTILAFAITVCIAVFLRLSGGAGLIGAMLSLYGAWYALTWIKKSVLPSLAAKPLLRRAGLAAFFGVPAAAIILALVAGASERSLPRGQAPPGQGPNVVMIVLDTVRSDHLSAYGYSRDTSPFLEQLKREGAIFTRAFSNSPWTLPSHATFFTGELPSRHGAVHGHYWLDSRFETIAEKLADRGRLTLALSANPWISSYTNLDQGFMRLVHPRSLEIERPKLAGEKLFRSYQILTRALVPDRGAADMNQTAVAWVDELADKRAPFFLFINYIEAHLPYPEIRDAYRFFPDPARAPKRIKEIGFNWLAYDAGVQKLSPAGMADLISWYDGSIRYLDDRTREIYDALEKNGLADNTIFIVLSDHGEGLSDHGLWGHEFGLERELLEVPLIIRYPRLIKPGSVIDIPVELRALPDAIISMILGQVPEIISSSAEGQLAGIWSERLRPRRFIELAKSFHPGFDEKRFDRDQKSLIVYPSHFIWDSEGPARLFFLDRDPRELTDVISQYPDLSSALQIRMAEFILASRPLYPDLEKPGAAAPGFIQRLRSLQYLK